MNTIQVVNTDLNGVRREQSFTIKSRKMTVANLNVLVGAAFDIAPEALRLMFGGRFLRAVADSGGDPPTLFDYNVSRGMSITLLPPRPEVDEDAAPAASKSVGTCSPGSGKKRKQDYQPAFEEFEPEDGGGDFDAAGGAASAAAAPSAAGAGAEADGQAGSDGEEEEEDNFAWTTTGNEHLRKRVLRDFSTEAKPEPDVIIGSITGWVSEADNEGTSLFCCQHDNGDCEDLDDEEVIAARQAWREAHPAASAAGDEEESGDRAGFVAIGKRYGGQLFLRGHSVNDSPCCKTSLPGSSAVLSFGAGGPAPLADSSGAAATVAMRYQRVWEVVDADLKQLPGPLGHKRTGTVVVWRALGFVDDVLVLPDKKVRCVVRVCVCVVCGAVFVVYCACGIVVFGQSRMKRGKERVSAKLFFVRGGFFLGSLRRRVCDKRRFPLLRFLVWLLSTLLLLCVRRGVSLPCRLCLVTAARACQRLRAAGASTTRRHPSTLLSFFKTPSFSPLSLNAFVMFLSFLSPLPL